MATFKLIIETGGAAFSDPAGDDTGMGDYYTQMELARMLREAAEMVEAGDLHNTYRLIYDANGNGVGRMRLRQED